jgi:hypothetical protein
MKVFPFFSVAALLLVTAPLRAQDACKIEYGRPGEVKESEGILKRFELLGQPEDKRKNFVKAVNLLTRAPEKVAVNPLGRDMAKGRAFIGLATYSPDAPAVVKRGDAGIIQDSTASIDLHLAADSAFDAVEAAQPGCKEETEEYRRKVYGNLVNSAVNLYNDRQVDSAEALSKKALMLYDDYKLSYIAYNILGNAQQSKDDYAGAVASFKKMAVLTKGDTGLVDERKSAIMMAAQLQMALGEQKEGAERKAEMNQVVAYLEEYLKEDPNDIKVQAAIARAQLLSGDEEAARRLFDQMLNNPDKYTDLQMLEAGVGAARADKNDVAASLFEAGLKKNPYSRDGLFNLVATYDATAGDTTKPAATRIATLEKMPPLLNRLIAIDPENPDNYRLWARYWQGKVKVLQPAGQKENAAPADRAALQTAIDSLTAYFTKFNEAKVKVSFSLFSHDGGTHTLGGSVDNNTDQEKSYILKFEFLDAAGTVLDKKDVPVENVPAKGSKSFRVQLTEKPGVIGFRYAPLP